MNEKIKEVGYAITKGGVGSIPLAGGVLSELFGLVFSDPATKRREQVLLDIDDRLKKLEEDGFDIQKLSESDEFLSISMQAYHIALRTHQNDKRVALMNAISNAPKLSIDENEKIMFLNYIDQFNEWHLRIFTFIHNPSSFFTENNKPNYSMAGKATILEDAFPELKPRKNFYAQITKDLYSRGLITIESLNGTMSGRSLWESYTTDTGKKFIEFISE